MTTQFPALLTRVVPLLALLLLPLTVFAQTDTGGKVVVIGFDGADAGLTEELMDEGVLPNLARLRNQGTYHPLGTTTPPQTPVSWSSFATGTNPGKHGIFDFLRRDLDTYQPDFAMFEIGSDKFLWGKNNHYLIALGLLAVCLVVGLLLGLVLRRPLRVTGIAAVLGVVIAVGAVFGTRDFLPHRKPTVANTRQGIAFWEAAGAAGIPATVVRVPATFPPQAFAHGSILGGLGVPDIRGTTGTYSFYTTDARAGQADDNTEFGGKIIEIALVNGETESYIHGPRNRLFDEPPDIEPPIQFKLDRTADPPTVTITACGQTQTVPLGGWSDWFTLKFEFSPLVKAYGTARFFLVTSEPFGLYMSPVNLDPHRPVMPVSEPPEFSRELAERFGLYKTLGWGMETWALNEKKIDEATFLEDVYFTEDKFAEMMRAFLDERDFDLYVHVYELTDRVAHMFWRLLDTEHPAYSDSLAAIYGDAVRDSYIYMDDVVGQVLDRLEPEDVLLIASDHGFHTWHKSVNYNTWLVKNGFMTLKKNVEDPEMRLEDLFGQGEFWPNVDWKRTKAYALGLGDIYINVKGREAQGIVEPGEEYERIRDSLIARLEAFQDPETGDFPVRRVKKREDVYSGYDPDLIPDLLAANNPKCRVSWQTSLGGIPKDLLEINAKNWSGDHCSLDADITKGIFFSNRKLQAEDVNILDFYPTVMGYLGIPVPDVVDGKALVPVN